MKYLLSVFTILTLTACGPNPEYAPKQGDYQTSMRDWQSSNGVSYKEFNLQDGTRCILSGNNSITCEWKSK